MAVIEKEKCKVKKRKTVNPAVGWAVLIVVLALILLSIFKPDIVGSFLKIMGSGKFHLSSLTENFRTSMDEVIRGLLLPKGKDPDGITFFKLIGMAIGGIAGLVFLGSAISERMYVGFGTGVLYAYLPVTAAIYIVCGIGPGNIYLTISLVMLCMMMLFSLRRQ